MTITNAAEPPLLPACALPVWEGPPARLSVIPPGGSPVRIDGAWWPRSRDVTKELPPLLAALDGRWGRITHVTLDAANWLEGPSALLLGGHTLRIHRSTTTGHRDAVCLLCRGVGRCDLIVVPPETSDWQARQLLTTVTATTSARMPATIPATVPVRG